MELGLSADGVSGGCAYSILKTFAVALTQALSVPASASDPAPAPAQPQPQALPHPQPQVSRAVLARVVRALTPVLTSHTRFHALCTAPSPSPSAGGSEAQATAESREALRDALLRAVFWLRAAASDEVAEASARVWEAMPHSEVVAAHGMRVLSGLALAMQTALFGMCCCLSVCLQSAALRRSASLYVCWMQMECLG